MKQSTKQGSVFLIYAHKDKEAVQKLYHRMVREGVQAWLDCENLEPGQDWPHEVRKAILKSEVVVVCLSQYFNEQQGYRHEELKIALEKANLLTDDQVFIIPVRLEPCDMPDGLGRLHRVDLFESGGYKRLIHALRKFSNKSQPV